MVRDREASCGNAKVEVGEACDDGNSNNADACTNACEAAACGDAVTRLDLSPNHDDFEQCDDGNSVDADTCRTNCRAAVCGDGVVRADLAEGEAGFEECDDGNQDSADGCTNGCRSGADRDRDGVIDPEDNCPDTANTDQADRDGDGLGDVCDDEPDQRNFRLRSAAALVLVQDGENNDHKLRGRVAGQGHSEATGTRFKIRGGLHVEPRNNP
jgi:cysteine-rich repeat protein